MYIHAYPVKVQTACKVLIENHLYKTNIGFHDLHPCTPNDASTIQREAENSAGASHPNTTPTQQLCATPRSTASWPGAKCICPIRGRPR